MACALDRTLLAVCSLAAQLCYDSEDHRASVICVDGIWRSGIAQTVHAACLPLLQVFFSFVHAASAQRALTARAASAMSLLLAVQLYVAHTLSSDPSHLENPASDAYVGSRVRCALMRQH